MLAREKKYDFRTTKKPSGLIIPAVIDDGTSFPQEVRAIQAQSLHEFANPFMKMDSPRQEELAETLRTTVCRAVEHTLPTVPQFDPDWEEAADISFGDAFRIQTSPQTAVPTPKIAAI